MNVLLIGGGGREHALAWALAKSPLVETIYACPGNPGSAQHATCVDLNVLRHGEILAWASKRRIGLVVVGPEAPLVAGIVDDLEAGGLKVFGPSRAAAQLEGSKHFTKALCDEAAIPTAAYRHFTDADTAKAYALAHGGKLVIKADGLAAGKGVTMAETTAHAIAAIDMCFDGAFGEAGAEVVIEDWLEGEEASFFVLTDGETAIPFGTAQDHKRVGDGDTGPNTGGMGAYSPAPIMSEAMQARVMNDIIQPTIATLAKRGTPYRGVLYAGLMLTDDGPKLIEYNVRFGDPECQVLMMRLQSDLLAALYATTTGGLARIDVSWRDDSALTVVMAADGYPGRPKSGGKIDLTAADSAGDDVHIFHAGTALRDGALVANGGRVLAVTALGANLAAAQDAAYAGVGTVRWPDGFYRSDIGWRAIGAKASKVS